MKRERGLWLWDIPKIISVCSVVVLIVIFIMSPATVASSTSVSIGSADITLGESVTLPLMIENAAEGISCATIVLSYDNAIAKVTSVGNSGFDALVNNSDNAQGRTTIVVYQTSAEGLTGNIKIADVTIEAIGVGSTSLNLEIETLKNNVGGDVSPDPISGSFTVKSSGSVTPSPSPPPSPSLSPTPTVKSPGGGGGAPSDSDGDGYSDREELIAGTDPNDPNDYPGKTPLSPSPSPSQPGEPTITIVQVGDATVERGELVNISIGIKGVGGEGLSSALINLTYDPKVVKMISVGNSDFDMFMPNIGKGIVRTVGFQTGIEGLKGDIKFAELQVKAVGKVNESSELKLEVKELTDNVGKELKEHEDFEVENGFFLITGEGKTEALSSAIWIWGVVGVVLLVVVIVGVCLHIKKKRK